MATIQSFIPAEGRFVDVEIPEPGMSKQSIEAYNRHLESQGRHMRPRAPSITPSCYPRANTTRVSRTQPPPAPTSYAAAVRAHVAELRDAAARILANANELEMTADKLEGK